MIKLSTLLTVFLIAIKVISQPTAGLVAYWPMNGNFNDAGPNAINGTNSGATATTSQNNSANTAMAFSNPGSTVDQYGSHPTNGNLSFGTAQDFTISFSYYIASPWIHTGGFYDNCLNYNGYGIWIWQNGGPTDYKIQFNFRNASVASTPQPLDTWIRVCAVRSGSTVKIYINGTLNSSGTVGTANPTYNYNGRFGTMYYAAQSPPNYNGFNGKMDEFRIYNRALSDAEISQLLPVKLTSFTATRKEQESLLRWTTHHEDNSSHFNVQRSTNGSDFITVGKVDAVGKSLLPTDYQFADKMNGNVASNILYYRLEQVDKNGKKEYSSTIMLKNSPEKRILSLIENPVMNDLRLRLNTEQHQQVQLTITDELGRCAISRCMDIVPGETFTVISASNLNKGVYFVTVIAEGKKETIRFVKQ